jgi:hypothetical protein
MNFIEWLLAWRLFLTESLPFLQVIATGYIAIFAVLAFRNWKDEIHLEHKIKVLDDIFRTSGNIEGVLRYSTHHIIDIRYGVNQGKKKINEEDYDSLLKYNEKNGLEMSDKIGQDTRRLISILEELKASLLRANALKIPDHETLEKVRKGYLDLLTKLSKVRDLVLITKSSLDKPKSLESIKIFNELSDTLYPSALANHNLCVDYVSENFKKAYAGSSTTKSSWKDRAKAVGRWFKKKQTKSEGNCGEK